MEHVICGRSGNEKDDLVEAEERSESNPLDDDRADNNFDVRSCKEKAQNFS